MTADLPAMYQKLKSIKFSILLSSAAVVVILSVGLIFGVRHSTSGASKATATPVVATTSHATSTAQKATTTAPTSTATPTPAPTPASSAKPATVTPATPVITSPTPTPAPVQTPWINTTNCLPQNPSQYQTYFVNDTNSQYLQTNSYVNTTKLYAALQFAGLLSTINSRQYVVLAMDDSQWSTFTQAQLNWLNASPANMRSLLGWQIITSCITWDGVNPVKDIPAGSTQTLSTLNGPVTFTSRGGSNGGGIFGSGQVGIWDWFTSNGSVTITGFVNPSVVP